MLNKVILIGNLGQEPEIRAISETKRVANLRVATSERWTDKTTGERKEKTEWSNVVVFNEGLINVIERYVKKGSKLYIEGKLQTRKWQDKDGNDKYTTEIVLRGFDCNMLMLDAPSAPKEQPTMPDGWTGKTQAELDAENTLMDDEIPF